MKPRKNSKPGTQFTGLKAAVAIPENPASMKNVAAAADLIGTNLDGLNVQVSSLEALVTKAREGFFGREQGAVTAIAGDTIKAPEGLIPQLAHQLGGSALAVSDAKSRIYMSIEQLVSLFERLGVTTKSNGPVR